MAFKVNDLVKVNGTFIESLKAAGCECNRATIESLGYLGDTPCIVYEMGGVSSPTIYKNLIRIKPNDTNSRSYNKGIGVSLVFCSDEHLNSSLKHA